MRHVWKTTEMDSTDVSPTQSNTAALPAIDVPAWAWALVAFAVFALYLVTLENGALAGGMAETMHEFMHHGRHAVAVPCH